MDKGDKTMLKLAAPWVAYFNEVKALFGDDPEIKLEYNNDNYEIKMYVDNQEKADALTQLIPAEKAFGNIVVKTIVIPSNKLQVNKSKLFEAAFKGNPAYSFMASAEGIFSNPITYIVFKNKVVQFWNDDLSDIYGNRSTLYQDIAKDIFGENSGIFFCTDKEEK